jgi:Tol biopolymer transport system component
VWSPDSSRLALTAWRVTTGSVVSVLELGTGVWTALGSGSNPQWSPDGTAVAFDRGGEVVMRRLDSTSTAPLAPGSLANWDGLAPRPGLSAWSPDGTRLLIVAPDGQAQVVSAAGGETVAVPRGLEGPAWTRDSSRLIVRAGGTLETVAIDGSDSEVISQDVLVPSVAVFPAAALSPDGRRVAFVRGSDHHFVVTDLAGHVLGDLGLWDPGPRDPRYGVPDPFPPIWSPDSTKVAYGLGGELVVADLDSGAQRTLAGGPGEGTGGLVWSADSSSVFVRIFDTTGNTDIYVARPDGKGVRPVFTDPLPEGGPVWSPDGRRLAFIRYGANPSLVVTDLNGHARVLATLPPDPSLPQPPVSEDSLWPSAPAWSPDGKTIAVVSNTHILLVNARTGSVHRWKAQTHHAAAVTWSRNGITYTDNGQEGYIWTVSKRNTWMTCVCGFTDPDLGDVDGVAANLAWSPDGRTLAYVRYGLAGNSFTALTWVTDSIQITDKNTRKTRSLPTDWWGFAWSPDGRYLIQGGYYNAEITRPDGHRVATLHIPDVEYPSWQPLCQRKSAS